VGSNSSLGGSFNIFWMPNSPIKELTNQQEGGIISPQIRERPPRMLGFGNWGGLRRIRDTLEGFRDRNRIHPSRFGEHAGQKTRSDVLLSKERDGSVIILNRSNNISKKMAEITDLTNFVISGVTRDSTGSPLGSCKVELFETATDKKANETYSDGSGNFTFTVHFNDTQQFYLVAYKNGSPDVAGTTIDEIQAVHP
jgi:hypothetical protein